MIDKDNIKYPPVEHLWRTFRRDRLDSFLDLGASYINKMDEAVAGLTGQAKYMHPLRLMLYSFEPGKTRAEAWEALLKEQPGNQTDLLLFFGAVVEAMGFLCYSEDKRIYRPDSALIESLMDVGIKKELPMSLFSMFMDGPVAFELPRKTAIGSFRCREILVCPFDIDFEHQELGPRSLAILGNFGEGLWLKPIVVLDLRGDFRMPPTASYSSVPMMEETPVDVHQTRVKAEGEVLAAAYHEPVMKMIHLILNLLLYMGGADDITTLVRSQRKNVEKRTPAEAQRIRDLQDPHVFGVGAKWGRAVQHWLKEVLAAGPRSNGVGPRFVSPHVRAAHSHLYWTGPGKTIPEIKFLLPILVKGGNEEGSLVEGDTIPIIHAMH